MEKQITVLGKKNFWYYVQLILVTPMWAFSDSPTKKSWEEFKSGLIKHKHKFAEKPYEINRDRFDATHWHACEHYGCNIVEPRHYPMEHGLSLERNMFLRQTKYGTFEEYLKNESLYTHGLEEPKFN